jgi:hypothetical protein
MKEEKEKEGGGNRKGEVDGRRKGKGMGNRVL